ncbi:MAG: hypothetical protein ACYS76_01070 [Planctomycetota bacterium]|jgi:hypothetical protein
MKTDTYPGIVALRKALSFDPHNVPPAEVHRRIRKLSQKKVSRALLICRRILNEEDIGRRRNQDIRICAIRVIVAAAPRSLPMIEELIRDREGRRAYEIHFTLFLFLDDFAESLSNNARVRRQILGFIRDYLQEIRRDNAVAAWKAGETLGWHWLLKESLPVLTGLVKHARYAAGREAAVEGLGYVLSHRQISGDVAKEILSYLKGTVENDRSYRVKQAALFVLGLQNKRRRQIAAVLRDIAKSHSDEEIREDAQFQLEFLQRDVEVGRKGKRKK